MDTLIGFVVVIAMTYWVGLFWFKAGRWVYLHGKDAQQRAVRFKEAVSSAMKDEP
jgi:hypothetical protein